MKNLGVTFFVAMAMILGCATTYDLNKETDQDRLMESSEIQRWVEFLKSENECNKLVWFYAMGRQAKMNPDGDNSAHGKFREQLLAKLSKRDTPEEGEQEALKEMYWLGFNNHPFKNAHSIQMKTCLETEGQRLNSYLHVISKHMEVESKKK